MFKFKSKLKELLLPVWAVFSWTAPWRRYCLVCTSAMPEWNDSEGAFYVNGNLTCSFVCAAKMSKDYPTPEIKVHDNSTFQWISGNDAFYVVENMMSGRSIRSSRLAAYKSKEDAERELKRAKNAQIIQSFDSLVKHIRDNE